MAKNNNLKNEEQANVAEALSKTEQFFEKNKKKIVYTITGVVVLIALIFSYKAFVVAPKQKEAQNQMFTAERYFRLDSFKLALDGDGNFLGFEKIMSKYGSKAGAAVYLYAGICELQLGNNDAAIKYLEKYHGKDNILLARAKACIGDALVNKGDVKSAVSHFKEAAKISDNIFSAGYLLKAGICYEELKQPKEALAMYQQIKDNYPQSPEGSEIDKYISRIAE